jgi:NADPH-dependent 2,4-dienoyl-CoA reductase/sulfur reductase-like enzyme/nitrite reductase/ring-hydroxylating ferredoxin subunit
VNKPEIAVANSDELRDGEMRRVKAGETEVLLARVDGAFYAVGAACTHYSAPLEKGLLHGTRLLCPWHHACFDLRTGAALEPPALDGLPCYKVRLEGQAVLVSTEPEPAPQPPRPRAEDQRRLVIVGGGAAGLSAALTLRREGFGGQIVMVTPEGEAPYDRPNLSKEYLAGEAPPEWLPLRPPEFYAEHGIELMTGCRVRKLLPEVRTLEFEDGSFLSYDACLVATGGVPRRLEVPGADLEGVFTLRNLQDARRLIAAAEGAKHAVVIGASFIGMETAASLRERGLGVTVVAPEQVPFEKVLGARVGQMFRRLHEEHGVGFRLGAKVLELAGEDRVREVVLESGERLGADLVIVGVGVRPATDFIADLPLGEDGSVSVDAWLRATPTLFAAGDIARFPDPQGLEPIRVEHWRLALQHGKVAALNLLGRDVPYAGVPFFWTGQFGLQLRYVGHAEGFDEVVYWGEPERREFLAFYLQGGVLRAASGLKRDREIDVLEELLRLNAAPSAEVLRAGPTDLTQFLPAPE